MIGARTADGYFTTDACVTEASACVAHVLDSYQAATLRRHVRNAVIMRVHNELSFRANVSAIRHDEGDPSSVDLKCI